MFNHRFNDKAIKIFALFFGALFAVAVIFLFNSSFNKQDGESDIDNYYIPKKATYDPSGNIKNISDERQGAQSPEYDLENEAQKFISLSDAQALGYYPTSSDFDSANSVVAKITPKTEFENVFSEKKGKIQALEQTEGKKGGYSYSLSEKEKDIPLLTPYYGYIIYTDSKSCKLMNSSLETLVGDFSGYTPAYKTDLCGNPLFIRDAEYYFYYDGKEYGGVDYSKIDENTFASLTAEPEPNSYEYFSYDRDLLLNMLASADTSGRNLENIVLSLEDGAGMVKYYPFGAGEEEHCLLTLSNNTDSYSQYLIPFCHHSYVKTQINEWDTSAKPQYEISEDTYTFGYLDKDGNIAIEPQYKTAYPFTPEGYAIIEDDNNRLCFIDTTGKVCYDPYRTLVNLPGLSGTYIHDGFYPREVCSIDTVGMFFFDNGYSLVRRKIVDSANGYKVHRDTNILITPDKNTFNYPQDYNLTAYSDGILLLEKNGLYGYMNTSGEWLVKPELVYAKPFSEGMAVLGYSFDKLGMIDTSGNILLAYCYSHIESASGGLVTAYCPELGWCVYSKMSTLKPQERQKDPRIDITVRQLAQAKAQDYEYNKQTNN